MKCAVMRRRRPTTVPTVSNLQRALILKDARLLNDELTIIMIGLDIGTPAPELLESVRRCSVLTLELEYVARVGVREIQ